MFDTVNVMTNLERRLERVSLAQARKIPIGLTHEEFCVVASYVDTIATARSEMGADMDAYLQLAGLTERFDFLLDCLILTSESYRIIKGIRH